eukprot:TRINITY_DN45485_c0_g1_i1.p1 TRINITY_DN45485_c0_g1~~TRINITY_DN45485_c0_g1_i1.p1  ORF type:complete len:313 (+),score=60.07 TRINITY_DN45485_c0_g1_i1:126-1064(+)
MVAPTSGFLAALAISCVLPIASMVSVSRRSQMQLMLSGVPLAGETSLAVRTFRTLDRNRDGVVDSDEVTSFARVRGLDLGTVTEEFAALDHDGDGHLNFQEISSALIERVGNDVIREQPSFSADTQVHDVATRDDNTTTAQIVLSSNMSMPVDSPSFPYSADKLGTRIRQLTRRIAIQEGDGIESMAGALAQEQDSEGQVHRFERMAAELRANASRLATAARQRATEEGVRAARARIARIVRTLNKLESGAQKADVTAAALRAQSQAELMHAESLMMAAHSALLSAGLSQEVLSVENMTARQDVPAAAGLIS